MSKEPKRGLYRRELVERAVLLIGGVASLSFIGEAAAQVAPASTSSAEQLAAAEPLAAPSGDFFASAFVTSPDLMDTNGMPKVGYRVGGGILPEYQRNIRAWGNVRSQEFEYNGAAAQLFQNALVVEDENGVSTVPVLDILTSQGLSNWLTEYGFDDPTIPVWKAAVASGRFVPPAALTPVDRELGFSRSFTQTHSRITVNSLDPSFAFSLDPVVLPYTDRYLQLFPGDTRYNFYFVSSGDEIPSALGVWQNGMVRERPYVVNINVGGPAKQEWLVQSANGQDFDIWMAATDLHFGGLDPATLLHLQIDIAQSAQGNLVELMGTGTPPYKRPIPGWKSAEILKGDQLDTYNSLVAEMRKNGMIIFDVNTTDAQNSLT
jgi:hypothetical protein